MSQTADFLFELGTEELPPKALLGLAEALADHLVSGLADAGLEPGEHTLYAAPRRMAVLIRDLRVMTEAQTVERRGPAVAAAFDADDQPTKALLGFARSCGAEIADLGRMETDKGSWMTYQQTKPGQAAAELIPAAIDQALAKLPIPKRMRWGAHEAEFIRPVHWAVALLGDDVVPATIMGVQTARETRGHRFHHPEAITVSRPDAYASLLADQGHVQADFDRRRHNILQQVERTAGQLGGRAIIDTGLLDEVTALVEWPVSVAGTFETEFLEVPAEALISTMQDNQKYFPLVDRNGKLMPHFITIANIDSRDVAAVRSGNERVIRPRFADAKFFWDEDRKQPLAQHLDSLKTVVFQQRLGTLFDKTVRVERLAVSIAGKLGADADLARRAARLSKCDLQSQMVGEFPELQGIMGRYLAAHDGEDTQVADALDQYYRPRRAGDDLPEGPVAQALALADRLDTLIGIFAIGQAPTGAKDPFALRRAALSVLRILIERQLDLDLVELLTEAANGLSDTVSEASDHVNGVFEFITERQRRYSLDRGIRHDVFDAVAAIGPTRPLDFEQRMAAVNAFLELSDAEALTAASKRIHNILKKQDAPIEGAVDTALLAETAEQALHERLDAVKGPVEQLLAEGHYKAALTELAQLRAAVDAFFDQVMVMSEDEALRRNRLAMLGQLSGLFMNVADLSLLNG